MMAGQRALPTVFIRVLRILSNFGKNEDRVNQKPINHFCEIEKDSVEFDGEDRLRHMGTGLSSRGLKTIVWCVSWVCGSY